MSPEKYIRLPSLDGSCDTAETVELRDADAVQWLDRFAEFCARDPQLVRPHLATCLRGFISIIERKRTHLETMLCGREVPSVALQQVTASPVVSAVLQALVNLQKVHGGSSAEDPAVCGAVSDTITELMSFVAVQRHERYEAFPPSIMTQIDTTAITARCLLRFAAEVLIAPSHIHPPFISFLVGAVIRATKDLWEVLGTSSPPKNRMKWVQEELKIAVFSVERITGALARSSRVGNHIHEQLAPLEVAVRGLLHVMSRSPQLLELSLSGTPVLRDVQLRILEDFLRSMQCGPASDGTSNGKQLLAPEDQASIVAASGEATGVGAELLMSGGCEAIRPELSVEQMLHRFLDSHCGARTQLTTQEAFKIMSHAKRTCEQRCADLSTKLAATLSKNHQLSLRNQQVGLQIEALRGCSETDSFTEGAKVSEDEDALVARITSIVESLELQLALTQEVADVVKNGNGEAQSALSTPAREARALKQDDIDLMVSTPPASRSLPNPDSPLM